MKKYNWKNQLKYMPLKKKLTIIIGIILLIQVISCIPIPFISRDYLDAIQTNAFSNGMLGIMTGASLSRMSIFALSVSPYITASIVIQLLTVVIPSLKDMQKESSGRDKYKKIIVFTGVGLAAIQAILMAIGFGRQGYITPYNFGTAAFCAVMWAAGASILIYIGEFIENFGLGSGISFLLLSNIISTIPDDMKSFYGLFVGGKTIPVQIVAWAAFFVVFFALIAACTFLTTTTKDIHVTYSGKLNGRVTKSSSTIPIPLVTCSVMPIIFAGSLCSIPAIIVQMTGTTNTVVNTIAAVLSPSAWFNPARLWYSLGAVVYIALTYFFTVFYLNISFNGYEIGKSLKENGGMIPGIRPGKPTTEYLTKTILQVALWGNTLLTGLIIIMYMITGFTGLSSLSMGSTSAIIAVSILNDLFEKIESDRTASSRKSILAFKSVLGRAN